MQIDSNYPADDDPIAIRVKELVSENRAISVEKLKWENTLYQDLCMYGDDVPDFFEGFIKEFNVDMKDFEFERYFPDETLSCFLNPFKAFFVWCSKSHRWAEPYEPITIKHLVDIAKSKKWQTCMSNRSENIKELREE